MDITISYVAVMGAAIVAYAVGALWHSPVGFGKYWMRLMGFDEHSMKSMPLSPTQAMTIGFFCDPAYGLCARAYRGSCWCDGLADITRAWLLGVVGLSCTHTGQRLALGG